VDVLGGCGVMIRQRVFGALLLLCSVGWLQARAHSLPIDTSVSLEEHFPLLQHAVLNQSIPIYKTTVMLPNDVRQALLSKYESQFKAELDALQHNVIFSEELSNPLDTYISDDRALFHGPNNGTWRAVFNREGAPTFRDLATIVASCVAQLAEFNPIGESRVILGRYKGERFVAGVASEVTNLTQLEPNVKVLHPIEKEVALWMYVGMKEFADLGALYVTQDGHLVRGDYETAFQHTKWKYFSEQTLETTFGPIKRIGYNSDVVLEHLSKLRESGLLRRALKQVRSELARANVTFPDNLYKQIEQFPNK